MNPTLRRGEQGQASVELALVLPLVVFIGLAVVQVAMVGRDAVLVSHAAREAARAASVQPGSGRAAAVRSGLDPRHLTVREVRSGPTIRVVVGYRAPTVVPLIGRLVPDVALSTRLTIRAETAFTHAQRANLATDRKFQQE